MQRKIESFCVWEIGWYVHVSMAKVEEMKEQNYNMNDKVLKY